MGGKKGFTLIELMVVLSIISIISLVGISALININSANTVDRAAEEITTAIRESQNKAISVASDPLNSGAGTPLAWGVEVDASAKSVQAIYLDGDMKKQTFGSPFDYSALEDLTITGNSIYFFTTPFGKYYSTNSFPTDITGWSKSSQRPYDILPASIISPVRSIITLNYRNSTKIVTVEENGDVHVQ